MEFPRNRYYFHADYHCLFNGFFKHFKAYVQGIGWIPVETTPGYSGNTMTVIPDEMNTLQEQTESQSQKSESKKDETQQNEQQDKQEETEEETGNPDILEAPVDEPMEIVDKPKKTSKKKV